MTDDGPPSLGAIFFFLYTCDAPGVRQRAQRISGGALDVRWAGGAGTDMPAACVRGHMSWQDYWIPGSRVHYDVVTLAPP